MHTKAQCLFILRKGILFSLISLFFKICQRLIHIHTITYQDIAALICITFFRKKKIIPTWDPNPVAQCDIQQGWCQEFVKVGAVSINLQIFYFPFTWSVQIQCINRNFLRNHGCICTHCNHINTTPVQDLYSLHQQILLKVLDQDLQFPCRITYIRKNLIKINPSRDSNSDRRIQKNPS